MMRGSTVCGLLASRSRMAGLRRTRPIPARIASSMSKSTGRTCGRAALARLSGVSEVEQVSAAERELVTAGWNDTARDVPAVVLPDLFAGQVGRTPDAVAVVCGGVSWSYAELDARWVERVGVDDGFFDLG